MNGNGDWFDELSEALLFDVLPKMTAGELFSGIYAATRNMAKLGTELRIETESGGLTVYSGDDDFV